MSELVLHAPGQKVFLTFVMAVEDELRRETSTSVLLVYCLAYGEDRGIHSFPLHSGIIFLWEKLG